MISVRRVGKTLSFYKAGLLHFRRFMQDFAATQAKSCRVAVSVMAFRGTKPVRLDKKTKQHLRSESQKSGITLRFA